MGCRGTIEIWNNGAAPKDEERPVVLYTHWGANDMENDLRDVLSKKKRWSDPAYLSRMIFSRMIKDDIDGETGYGIQTCNIGDAEREIIIDCDRQEVIVKGWRKNITYTFNDYIDSDKYEERDKHSYLQNLCQGMQESADSKKAYKARKIKDTKPPNCS